MSDTLPIPSPYPPANADPAVSSTPTRTTILNTRGSVIPGADYVMTVLQQLYPRRIFPDTGTADQQRMPVIDPAGWQRGGTSPAGASLGGTPGGNWFVGSAERYLNDAAPQRIIWEPPGPGEEDWAPPQQMGPYKDPAIVPLPQLFTPQSPVTEEQFRQMAEMATGQLATRIIPMKVHLWGSDWSDTEELVHWFGSACQVCFNGNTSVAGFPLLGPGGWVEDPKGTRGIHYVLTVRLTAPVHYPYYAEVVARSAYLRLSGAAPNTVLPDG
jgi:hypothetical protein